MPADSRCDTKVLKLCLKSRAQNSEKVPVNNLLTTERGLNFFGDVSGRFSNFAFHFLFCNSKLLGQCCSAEVPP